MITAIEVQKNNKNKVNLYIDGEFKCGLTMESVLTAGLKIGDELSEQTLKEILENNETQLAFDKAINYISRCMKSKHQVTDYLLTKGFDIVAVTNAIKKLEHYGYINDDQYISMYIADGKKTKGTLRIKQELYLKGIQKDLIEQAILDIDSQDLINSATALAKKYIKNKTLDRELLAKTNRYLLSRGYDFDIVNKVLKQIKEAINADIEDEDY